MNSIVQFSIGVALDSKWALKMGKHSFKSALSLSLFVGFVQSVPWGWLSPWPSKPGGYDPFGFNEVSQIEVAFFKTASNLKLSLYVLSEFAPHGYCILRNPSNWI